MSTIIAIADAVVTQLNSPPAPFNPTFTAERVYWATQRLERLTGMRVVVVPTALDPTTQTRGKIQQRDYTIDVAVQKKIPSSLAELDPLMTLAETLYDYLLKTDLPTYPTARCVAVANDPIYAEDHIKQFSVFTSLLVCTYRLIV